MSSRVLSLSGLPESQLAGLDPEHDVVLDWVSDRRNSTLGDATIEKALGVELDRAAKDMLEVAAAIVLGDQCSPRGTNEAWVRDVEFVISVRHLAPWRAAVPLLRSLLHLLTWDNMDIEFVRRPGEPVGQPRRPETADLGFDCVALLSGGIDSFAGAVTLLEADRKPLFVTHRSANPAVFAAQRHVLDVLEARYAGRFGSVLVPLGSSRFQEPAYALPGDEERETSQRARST